jgi:hypothetical protein
MNSTESACSTTRTPCQSHQPLVGKAREKPSGSLHASPDFVNTAAFLRQGPVRVLLPPGADPDRREVRPFQADFTLLLNPIKSYPLHVNKSDKAVPPS